MEEIQRKLAVLGYYPAQLIDGLYGKKTQAAIDEFKEKYNITDEEVDEKLSEVIMSMMPDSADTFTDKFIKVAKAMGASVQQAAYMLATFKHETNGTFKPVEEAYWLSTSAREKYLNSKPYGVRWSGRGYVQVTWEDNYKMYEKLFQIPFTQEPEIMLDADVALLVGVHGCMTGLFTTKKLSDYINNNGTDYLHARKVVNGMDDAELIAGYAKEYEKALTKGGY